MVVQQMPYKVHSVGVSDIGLVRKNNEDVWTKLARQRLYIIADGMGGHQAGEVASHEAVRALCEFISEKLDVKDPSTDLDVAREILYEAIQDVNAHVFQMSRND